MPIIIATPSQHIPVIDRSDGEGPTERVTLFPVMPISEGNPENLHGQRDGFVPRLPVNNVSPNSGAGNDRLGRLEGI